MEKMPHGSTTDPDRSVCPPASVTPWAAAILVEKHCDTLGLSASPGEPVVGNTPYFCSPLSPAVSSERTHPSAGPSEAINQTKQQVWI